MTHLSCILWNEDRIQQALQMKVTQPFCAHNVCIDTRLIEKDDLFVAIKGEVYDGHAFLEEAQQKGATACLVQEGSIVPPSFPAIKVADTARALEQLGRWNVQVSKALRIGVTGSVGKTSTKEMLAIVLSAYGKTYATQGNLNNHYGLPLTMARMPQETKYGVFEMGMNHGGELSQLSQLLAPDIAIITSVAPAHLAHFSSVKAIAEAKAEIMSGMKEEGLLILSRDIVDYDIITEQARDKYNIKNIVSVGMHEESDIRLMNYTTFPIGGEVLVTMQGKEFSYKLSVSGKHQAHNSLFALAILDALNLPQEKGIAALSDVKGIKGRGERLSIKIPHASEEITVIDDSYNANPASMKAAIVMLGALGKEAKKGRTIAVLGDMKELGENSCRYHKDLKDIIAENRIDKILTVGDEMQELAHILPKDVFFIHADTSENIISPLISFLQKDDILLIKGSFSMKMNKIILHLTGYPY